MVLDKSKKLTCPLTQWEIVNPCTASDGFVYEFDNLAEWIARLKDDDAAVVSPVTGEPISEDIQKDQTEGHPTETCDAPPSEDAAGKEPEIESINSCAKIFSIIDPLVGFFNQELENWNPPTLAVVGNENSGKSTLLERIAMIPIFPADEELCTRVPILVKLRRGLTNIPKIEVYNNETNEVESSELFCSKVGNNVVSKKMVDIISQQEGKSISNSKSIILKITRPDVPNINMLDIPGLVSSSIEGEASTIADDSKYVVSSEIEKLGEAALFLVTCSASTPPNQSLAFDFIQKLKLEDKTIGCITMADNCVAVGRKKNKYSLLADRVQQKSKDVIPLNKNGYITTMLAGCFDSDSESESEADENCPKAGNTDRATKKESQLKGVATYEYEWFQSTDKHLKQLLDQQLAGSNALVNKISSFLEEYTIQDWVPLTLEKTYDLMQSLHYSNAELGLPPIDKGNLESHKKRIQTNFESVLTQMSHKVFEDYCDDVLNPLGEEIEKVLCGSGKVDLSCLMQYKLDTRAKLSEAIRSSFETSKEFLSEYFKMSIQVDTGFNLGRFPKYVNSMYEHWLDNAVTSEFDEYLPKKMDELLVSIFEHCGRLLLQDFEDLKVVVTFDTQAIVSFIKSNMIKCLTVSMAALIACTSDSAMTDCIEIESCGSERAVILDRIEKCRATIRSLSTLLAKNKQEQWRLVEGNDNEMLLIDWSNPDVIRPLIAEVVARGEAKGTKSEACISAWSTFSNQDEVTRRGTYNSCVSALELCPDDASMMYLRSLCLRDERLRLRGDNTFDQVKTLEPGVVCPEHGFWVSSTFKKGTNFIGFRAKFGDKYLCDVISNDGFDVEVRFDDNETQLVEIEELYVQGWRLGSTIYRTIDEAWEAFVPNLLSIAVRFLYRAAQLRFSTAMYELSQCDAALFKDLEGNNLTQQQYLKWSASLGCSQAIEKLSKV